MRKLFRVVPLLSLIIVSGCVGNNDTHSSVEQSKIELTKKTTTLQNINDSNQIPFLEVNPLKSGQCDVKLCNKESSICAELKFCVSAQYAAGRGGSNYWVAREDNVTSGAFKLIFNKNGISKDFHLANIYNDLQGNSAVGQVEQIDTRACSTLLNNGYKAGDSCNLDFIYSGNTFDQKINLVHFIFKSSNDSESLDFSFPVYNNYVSNQNIPIVDMVNDEAVTYNFNSLMEIPGSQGLGYSSEYSQLLINNGIDPLHSFNDAHGNMDILVSLATKMNVNSSPLYNRSGPSCGSASIDSGGTCRFNFNDTNIISSESSISESRRFAYQYSNDQMTRNITNTKFTVVGVGDIVVQDFFINKIGSGLMPKISVNIIKQNYGNNALSYNIPLKKVKFYLSYDPLFPIQTDNIESDRMAYAYGDYDGVSAASLIDNAKFDYDPACFDNGFQLNKANNLTYDSCPVEITLNHGYANKPLQFQLWVNYDSPVGKHINQLVGNVLVANSLPYPVHINAVCKSDNQFKTGFYGSEYRCYYEPLDKEWGGAGEGTYSANLDYNNCASGSGISNITLRLDNGTNSPTYLQQLKCDSYNYKFPKGSYTDQCFNMDVNGSILTATCKGLTTKETSRPIFEVPVSSSIDFTQCSTLIRIDSSTGKLVCN